MPASVDSRGDPRRTDLHESWIEAISSVARVVPNGSFQRVGKVAIVRSGLLLTAFNIVFALENAPAHPDLQERINRSVGVGGIPWCLVTTTESAPAYDSVIRALGLRQLEKMPGMVWEPLPDSAPEVPPELEIRPTRSVGDAKLFARTMMEGFEVSPDLMDPWVRGVETRGFSKPAGSDYYVGFLEGFPVCTAVRVVSRGISGIYGVSTLPRFRRRGLGETITRFAALCGGSEGCLRSYLQSSRMGRSVYEKIGYREVEEYQLWVPERRSPDSRESR